MNPITQLILNRIFFGSLIQNVDILNFILGFLGAMFVVKPDFLRNYLDITQLESNPNQNKQLGLISAFVAMIAFSFVPLFIRNLR